MIKLENSFCEALKTRQRLGSKLINTKKKKDKVSSCSSAAFATLLDFELCCTTIQLLIAFINWFVHEKGHHPLFSVYVLIAELCSNWPSSSRRIVTQFVAHDIDVCQLPIHFLRFTLMRALKTKPCCSNNLIELRQIEDMFFVLIYNLFDASVIHLLLFPCCLVVEVIMFLRNYKARLETIAGKMFLLWVGSSTLLPNVEWIAGS